MTEHTQIVRKLRNGESMPSYSTLALLFGVTFPAPVIPPYDPRSHKPRSEKAAMYWRQCEDSHEKIAELIQKGLSNRVIGERIGIKKRPLMLYIQSDDQLKRLSDARKTTKLLRNLPPPRELSDDVFEQRYGVRIDSVLELRQQGKSYMHISRILGVNRYTVRRVILSRLKCESTES